MTAAQPDIRAKLRRFSANQQDFSRLIAARLGVDAAGLAVMFNLGSSGPATPTDVARALKISTAAATLVLNRLATAGHISRQPHERDRRKVLVVPNPASLAAAFELVRPFIDGVQQLTGAMTPEHRAVVADFLDRISDLCEAAQRPLHDAGPTLPGRPNEAGRGGPFLA